MQLQYTPFYLKIKFKNKELLNNNINLEILLEYYSLNQMSRREFGLKHIKTPDNKLLYYEGVCYLNKI